MSLVPPNVERLVPYSPGKPIEELERELGIENAIKLASNENPYGPSPKATEAMRAHLSQVHRYPDASTFLLRGELARFHGVEPDEIVVGNGSNELIDLICRTYAGPDDHALIGFPSFVCYHLGLTSANVPYDAVSLRDHLFWDLDAMAAKVRAETKIVFVANPNNPTATHVGRAALEKFLTDLPPKVVAVIDEAYVQFVDADDFMSALELRETRERLIVLRTFSKAYGLAANRVGYAVGPAPIVGYLNRVRAPFNVSTLAQVAARAALTDQAYVEDYVRKNNAERARLSAALRELGYRVAPSQTNFLFVDFAAPNTEVYERLLRRGVIVRPIPVLDGTWMRITVGLAQENERLLAALRELTT